MTSDNKKVKESDERYIMSDQRIIKSDERETNHKEKVERVNEENE